MLTTYPTKKICGIVHVKRPCKDCGLPVWFQADSERNICNGCALPSKPLTVGNDKTLRSPRSERRYQGD